MGPELLVTLSTPPVRAVFSEIVKNRSVLFRDIRKNLLNNDDQISHPSDIDKQIVTAVKVLKDAQLIRETPADIRDFNSYYVTSDGLNAARQLSRFSAA